MAVKAEVVWVIRHARKLVVERTPQHLSFPCGERIHFTYWSSSSHLCLAAIWFLWPLLWPVFMEQMEVIFPTICHNFCCVLVQAICLLSLPHCYCHHYLYNHVIQPHDHILVQHHVTLLTAAPLSGLITWPQSNITQYFEHDIALCHFRTTHTFCQFIMTVSIDLTLTWLLKDCEYENSKEFAQNLEHGEVMDYHKTWTQYLLYCFMLSKVSGKIQQQ